MNVSFGSVAPAAKPTMTKPVQFAGKNDKKGKGKMIGGGASVAAAALIPGFQPFMLVGGLGLLAWGIKQRLDDK